MVTRWKSTLRAGKVGKGLGVAGKFCFPTMGGTYPVVGKASPDPRHLINLCADPEGAESTGLVDSHSTSANKSALVAIDHVETVHPKGHDRGQLIGNRMLESIP